MKAVPVRPAMTRDEFVLEVQSWEPRFLAIADELHDSAVWAIKLNDPPRAEMFARAEIMWRERASAARHGYLLIGPQHMLDRRYAALPLQRLWDRAISLGRALLTIDDLVERTGIEV